MAHIRTSLIALAAVGALALTGCNTPKTDSPTPAPTQINGSHAPSASGSAPATPKATPSASSAAPAPTGPVTNATDLEAIKVEGEPLKEPKVTVPAPWVIDATKTKVLKEGTGPTVGEKATVKVHYYGVNGRTGKNFDQSYNKPGGEPIAFSLDGVVPGFKKGLMGQKVGSRVLIAMPSADGYGDQGSPQADIQKGDTLLFVVDIIAASLDKPEGDKAPVKEGLPTVSDDIANPKVTVPPNYQAPKETVVQPIIIGKGDKVKETDAVTVRYQCVSAKTGQVIESDYGKDPETAQLSKLIPGWKKGLKDQPVGSRLLLVVPASDAYPKGNATPKIDADDTLIYTVDILFAQAGQ